MNADPPQIAFADRRVAFLGKLGGATRRDATQRVRGLGGHVVPANGSPDVVVLGADELPLGEGQLLAPEIRSAASRGELEIISETQFWQRVGDLREDAGGPNLYTPAQLAELLDVSVATIRRWARRGLLHPVTEVHRLPYFDFQEAATARRIAKLLAEGASPKSIERQLEQLAKLSTEWERPLAQLAVLVEGRHVLLRREHDLIEPSGQMRIDFDALDRSAHATRDDGEFDALDTEAAETVPLPPPDGDMTGDELRQLALQYDEEDRLSEAAEAYRAALGVGGPDAEICFQLAEILYRMDDVSAARERYFMAVELDGDYVEARANLGCVLAETGETELAIAAFEGALQIHPKYADVYYHLARALDELGRFDEAAEQWSRFLMLAPTSPWADEARRRLDLSRE